MMHTNIPLTKILAALLIAGLAIYSCKPESIEVSDEEYKKEFSSKLFPISQNEDSLKATIKECIKQGDGAGAIITYRQLGKYYRDNARFSEAIVAHQNGLELALDKKDTLEIVQAYNNLGTDFRRIGVLAEASGYHYQALTFAEAYSKVDEPGTGMKNRVVSLNGLGNISLTLGYHDEAEKYFRSALKDEIRLASPIGQAINYANIGSIFEHRQQYDSARVYYEHSMVQNRLAKSDMGIGLCHIHFGDLYTIEKKYDQAKAEYLKAFHLMQNISDRWHWLEASLAIAEINLLTNDIGEFEKYIRIAEETAEEINSPEHLAKVFELKHDYFLNRSDYANALYNYKRSIEMIESVQGVQKSNIYMDMRVNYERDRNARHIAQLEAISKSKETRRKFISYILIGIILIGGVITILLYYAYKQRIRSNLLLKKMEHIRSDFFTNITHELRTPLTVIQGLNKQIGDKEDITEKEKVVYREAIDRQSRNLLQMVNLLLDIAKVGSGTDRPDWRNGDMVSYLSMVAETFQLYAKSNNIDLIFYSDSESLYMDFVPFYLDRIVSNLLSNAIKHSIPGDKIHLIFTKGNKSDTAIIRVTDTGEGIPTEDLERIFEMFYQSAQSENVSGSGIGLSFVKLMVNRMGGKVEVESQLGKGSSFTVTLPIKNDKLLNILPIDIKEIGKKMQIVPTETIKEQVDGVIGDDESCTNPVILIVEDNKDVAMYLKSLLHNRYNILTARNGEEGYSMAEEHIPELIITDIMMPIKDGYQLCHEMRENRLLNHIPIIMLTAKATDEDRLKGLECGVHAYLQKPFHPDELLLHINNIFESRKLLKEKYMNVMVGKVKDETLKLDENMIFLQTVTDIIHSQIENPKFDVTFLADKMAVSISQLNRKMKAITDCSTISYILKVRLCKARKMLSDSDLQISEVSDLCGFSDSNYFARVFKKEFGFTPSQIQRRPNNVNFSNEQ